jgi:hypothetical protein
VPVTLLFFIRAKSFLPFLIVFHGIKDFQESYSTFWLFGLFYIKRHVLLLHNVSMDVKVLVIAVLSVLVVVGCEAGPSEATGSCRLPIGGIIYPVDTATPVPDPNLTPSPSPTYTPTPGPGTPDKLTKVKANS